MDQVVVHVEAGQVELGPKGRTVGVVQGLDLRLQFRQASGFQNQFVLEGLCSGIGVDHLREPMEQAVDATAARIGVGDLDTLEVPLHAVSRGSGVTILSLDYALAPEHMYPIALEQCQDGLLWADQHRAELGVDGPLGVGGDSAGGNFAALLSQWAVATGGPTLDWQVLINPVLDFPAVEKASTESHRLYGDSPMLSTEAMQVFLASYFESPAAMVEASPLCTDIDCSALPPAFIAVGECDALHDDSVNYAKKLRAAGVPVQLEVYQGMPHNFMTLTNISGTARRFLKDLTDATTAWANGANAGQP